MALQSNEQNNHSGHKFWNDDEPRALVVMSKDRWTLAITSFSEYSQFIAHTQFHGKIHLIFCIPFNTNPLNHRTHSITSLTMILPSMQKVSTIDMNTEQIYRFSRILKWYNVLLGERNKLKSEMYQIRRSEKILLQNAHDMRSACEIEIQKINRRNSSSSRCSSSSMNIKCRWRCGTHFARMPI